MHATCNSFPCICGTTMHLYGCCKTACMYDRIHACTVPVKGNIEITHEFQLSKWHHLIELRVLMRMKTLGNSKCDKYSK